MTIKHDNGKPRPGLVLNTMSRAIQAVVDVAEHGARKYSPDNWLTVPNAQHRYTDAMLRHLLAEQTGEAKDADSGLLHAAHAAWGALARLDLMLRKAEQVKVPTASIAEPLRPFQPTPLRPLPPYPGCETQYPRERHRHEYRLEAAEAESLRRAGLLNDAVTAARNPDRPFPGGAAPGWPQQLVKWLRHYSKAFGPLADRGLLIAQYCSNTHDMRVIGAKAGRYSGLLAMINAVPQDGSAAGAIEALGLAVDEAVTYWDSIHAESVYVGFVLDTERKAAEERQAKRAAEAAKRRDEAARQQRLLQSPNRVAMAGLKHQLAQSLELNKLAKPLERLRRAGRLVATVEGLAVQLSVLDPASAPLVHVWEWFPKTATREQEQQAIRKAVAEAYRRLVTMPGLERYITPTVPFNPRLR